MKNPAPRNRCESCPNRSSRVCGTRGPENAPITIVGMSPGKDELVEGIPFVGASGRMMAHAFADSKADLDECFITNVVNCFPAKGDKLSGEQTRACRERLFYDLDRGGSPVIVPVGGDALEAITGLKGPNNGITSWRGYVIDPLEVLEVPPARSVPRSVVPPTCEYIVPVFHPSFIMRTGLRYFHYLSRDINRAIRASRGELNLIETIPTNSGIPVGTRFPRLAIDIETKGLSDQIEQIGLAWNE